MHALCPRTACGSAALSMRTVAYDWGDHQYPGGTATDDPGGQVHCSRYGWSGGGVGEDHR